MGWSLLLHLGGLLEAFAFQEEGRRGLGRRPHSGPRRLVFACPSLSVPGLMLRALSRDGGACRVGPLRAWVSPQKSRPQQREGRKWKLVLVDLRLTRQLCSDVILGTVAVVMGRFLVVLACLSPTPPSVASVLSQQHPQSQSASV